MLKKRPIWKIINEICREEDINVNTFSYGYITELEKNGKKKRIVGNSLEINSANSYKIASDKYATYEMLKAYNVPTIEHYMIFNPNTRSDFSKNEIEKAIKIFHDNNDYVILKSNDSSEGKYVFDVLSEEKLKKLILELFEEKKDTLSICPFYEIDYEYRVIFLDGKALFTYKKEKPCVYGNGISTLKELIIENEFQDIYSNLDLNYIPKESEKIEVSWKHNLSRGANPSEIEDDKIKEKVESLAVKAADVIGITFATVDIVHTKNNEFLVMEINSSVCMDKFSEKYKNGYEITKNVFKSAIAKMFKD